MEHNNAASTTTTNLRQQQHHQQQQQSRDQSQLSQKLQEQQQQQQQQQSSHHQQQSNNNNNNNDHQQQFCLRWHNHQTSLLSTLPVLLDQSHLTDVTISAEGRTLRAHRVVLSACSSFFLEIFRTLESTHHPVIIIPGASFSAIVALLTFMYSGEVNVYEEQIPMLLSLAETLGIKGLADVHNNKSSKTTNDKEPDSIKEELEKSPTPPSPQPPTSASGHFSIPQAPAAPPSTLNTNAPSSTYNPLLNPALNPKFSSSLENFFLKSLQFYPNLINHQPLNFSQTALNKTSELLAKYQQQCNIYQANLGMNPKDLIPLLHNEEDALSAKRFCSGLEKKSPSSSQQNQMTLQQQKDIKRIDKIVENLRGGGGSNAGNPAGNSSKQQNHENNANSPLTSHLQNQLSPLSIKTSMENYTSNPSPLLTTPKSSIFSSPTTTEASSQMHSQLGYNISAEDQLKLQQHLDKYAASCARTMEVANENLKNEASRMISNEKLTTPQSPQAKTPSNSKLYATCFICHKQLSNQYNLRVHLETHQNVRYACNVCSHVSRSKDALRKHVSYRHPGAPSPCETEARRKRANKVLANQLNATNLTGNSPSSGEITPTSPNTMTPHFQGASSTTLTPAAVGNELNCGETTQQLTAAQLSSAYQMFMPNQFHLAAAANAAQQQQQQQQHQQQQQLSEQQQISGSSSSSTNTAQNKEYLNTLSSSSTATQMNTTITTTSSSSSMSEASKSSLNNSNNLPTPTPNTAAEYQNSTNTNSVESRISPTAQP